MDERRWNIVKAGNTPRYEQPVKITKQKIAPISYISLLDFFDR